MHELTHHMLHAILQELGGGDARCSFHDEDSLPSIFGTSDLAAASIAAAGAMLARLPGVGGEVAVSRRLASLWFGMSIQPDGWQLPPLWDAVAGDYRAADRWIRLHTNAPHHRAAALAVLGCAAEREAVARAVAGWQADDLEAAVLAQGGCAATMRSVAEWREHPQGHALADEPLFTQDARPRAAVAAGVAPGAAGQAAASSGRGAEAGAGASGSAGRNWRPDPKRPLQGIRVLDLTRVLAGPIATRFLAGFGAEVLRIDPPTWDEAGVIPEVTLGKRCARLDLTAAADRAIFERLLAEADVLVHGYRNGALEDLGYGPEARAALNPDLIDVSLNAYGWSGPWRDRRGFDSLVQMSCGIADAGMSARAAEKPVPLPVQALDHATGYLMAAAVVHGLRVRLEEQQVLRIRLSLARTARLLTETPRPAERAPWEPLRASDIAPALEQTSWGRARRLHAPLSVGDTRMHWTRPATALGTAAPRWE